MLQWVMQWLGTKKVQPLLDIVLDTQLLDKLLSGKMLLDRLWLD